VADKTKIPGAIEEILRPAMSDAVRRTSARLETDRTLEKMFKRLCKILKL
jgi:hypothetical protein